jgi:hypothetical protein
MTERRDHVNAALADLVSRQAIATVLAVHSRGVDRADASLLGSAYHADATVDYGFFVGPASGMVTILAAAQKGQPVTLHRTCNLWIAVDGDHARSESYVIACMEHATEQGPVQRLVGGRYLDVHARRAGEWRLGARQYVMDWNINRPGTAVYSDPAVALTNYVPRGGQGAADAGRALLALGAARFKREGDSQVTTKISDRDIDVALSKQALHDLGMAYARGVDRADPELLLSIFHEDSTVISGVINGSGPEFARGITEFVRANLERCFHSVANEWYEVDGDRAVGESYGIATVTAGGNDVISGGRYIDTYERRKGVWKFASRTWVSDWTMTLPTTHQTDGMFESLKTRGCYGKDDPIYRFWKT